MESIEHGIADDLLTYQYQFVHNNLCASWRHMASYTVSDRSTNLDLAGYDQISFFLEQFIREYEEPTFSVPNTFESSEISSIEAFGADSIDSYDLKPFTASGSGMKGKKYVNIVKEVIDRKRRNISIELDDVEAWSRVRLSGTGLQSSDFSLLSSLSSSIANNALRYICLFEVILDKIVDEEEERRRKDGQIDSNGQMFGDSIFSNSDELSKQISQPFAPHLATLQHRSDILEVEGLRQVGEAQQQETGERKSGGASTSGMGSSVGSIFALLKRKLYVQWTYGSFFPSNLLIFGVSTPSFPFFLDSILTLHASLHPHPSPPNSTLQQSELSLIPKNRPKSGDLFHEYDDDDDDFEPSKPISIRQVKGNLIGKLITVEGIVTRVSEVKPMLQVATYSCDVCGSLAYQHIKDISFMPLKMCQTKTCQNSPHGGRMRFHTRGSKFIRFQQVKIQELANQVPIGHIPRSVSVNLIGEQTRKCLPGDVVTIHAIFLPTANHGFNAIRSGLVADTFLLCQSIILHKKRYGGEGGGGRGGRGGSSSSAEYNDSLSAKGMQNHQQQQRKQNNQQQNHLHQLETSKHNSTKSSIEQKPSFGDDLGDDDIIDSMDIQHHHPIQDESKMSSDETATEAQIESKQMDLKVQAFLANLDSDLHSQLFKFIRGEYDDSSKSNESDDVDGGFIKTGIKDENAAKSVNSDSSSSSLLNHYEILANSIAPEIFGHLDVKKALLLQMVGGVSRIMEDGMRIRGDINILLMGDPGVAKSQLLKHIVSIAPRAVYTSGKGSTGVGLTAAVIRDPMTKEFVLEGGSLTIADMGICCIDEFDKMDDSDRTAIHEVMEQQTISIAKAGITTTLNARTSVLAAANPAWGRYNPRRSPSENMNLPASLISRFDLIFLLLDKPDSIRDRDLAMHITHVHRNGRHPPLRFEPLKPNLMRAYISMAKLFNPYVPHDLASHIISSYCNMRQNQEESSSGGGSKSFSQTSSSSFCYITARSLLAILRLSQAIARLRLSSRVSKPDIDEAIRLINFSNASQLTNGNGGAAGSTLQPPKSSNDPITVVYRIIRDYAQSRDTSVMFYDELLPHVLLKGHSQALFDNVLDSYDKLQVWSVSANRKSITLMT